jgi:ribokinase
MSLPSRVVVVGSANMDLVFRTPRFPAPGETLIGGEFATYPGGKGANQAVAIGRLGGNPIFVGKVGEDAFGTSLTKSLETAGVDTSELLRAPGSPTGVAGITVDDNGQNAIVVASGANFLLTWEEVRGVLRKGLGSVLLIQHELRAETVDLAIEYAKEMGMVTVVNPAPARNLSPDTLKRIDYLTPNETEASYLTGMDPSGAACYGELLEMGVGTVITTLGANGAQLFAKGHTAHFPALPVTPVDTTAAGDAFSGALAYCLSQDHPIEEAIPFANKVAALSTTRPGAQASMPTLAEVRALSQDKDVFEGYLYGADM